MKKRFYFSLILLIGTVTNALPQSMTIGGGYESSAMICSKGNVYHWGSGVGSSLPVKVNFANYPELPDGVAISMVSAGSGNHRVALTCEGMVFAWGNNSQYQCGATTPTSTLTPIPVPKGATPGYYLDGTPGGPYLGNVKYVTGSNLASFAILNTGEVVGWGGGGNWSAAATPNPFYITYPDGSHVTHAIHITGGDNNILITVDEDGDGLGDLYSLGNFDGRGGGGGVNNYVARPVLRDDTRQPLTNIRMSALWDKGGFAVDEHGYVWGWGDQSWGCAAGIGGNADVYYPRKVLAGEYGAISGEFYLTDVVEVIGGQGHGMAITKEGYVLAWGNTIFNNAGPACGVGPIFVNYCSGGRITNAVHIGRGDTFGFMVNDKDEYYAMGSNPNGALGIGAASQGCFTKMNNLPCATIDPCPEAFMPQVMSMCPDKPLDLFTGFTTPVGKEIRYYFSWSKDGVPLNTSTITQAKAYRKAVEDPDLDYSVCNCDYCPEGDNLCLDTCYVQCDPPTIPPPPAATASSVIDPYNRTTISVLEPGIYTVEIEYIGNNIPCDACKANATVEVRYKEINVETNVTEVCINNPDRPVASEEICFNFTSTYNIPSNFEIYTQETGGQLLQTYNFPASGDKSAELCVSGDKVGVEKRSPDDILYTLWLEDKTKETGTFISSTTGCAVSTSSAGTFLQVTIYETVHIESFTVNVTTATGTLTPVMRTVSMGQWTSMIEPGATIWTGTPVTARTGELVIPVNRTIEVDNPRGVTFFIGVTGGSTLSSYNCNVTTLQDSFSPHVMGANGNYSGTAFGTSGTRYYNFQLSKLSSFFDCRRLKLAVRYDCPCPEVESHGPVCSEDGSFTMVKTPDGVKGNWNSSNPAFVINEFGGVIIPQGLTVDTDVTFRFTATSSGCWDEKTVRITAKCNEQICPADPFNPTASDNICFELNTTPTDEYSTYTVYDAVTGGNQITTFSLGYGTRRGFCVPGDKIDKILAIKQEGSEVKYSVWADENIREFLPDTIIARYDTVPARGGTIGRGTATGTCTLYVPAGDPAQGVIYSDAARSQLAGMTITTTDSLKINSLKVRAAGMGNGGNATNISLRAVVYEVSAGGNIRICETAYTTRNGVGNTAEEFTINFEAGCGNLAKNKTYLISYEYSASGRTPGVYGHCYTGAFGAPSLGGLTIGTPTANVFNDISYDVIKINTLPPIIKPGAPINKPSNDRKELNSFCVSSCVPPAKPTKTGDITLCAGDTPPNITSYVVGYEASMLWYSATAALPGAPLISSTNTGTDPIVTTYYVSKKVDVCESEKEAITVTVNPIPTETLTAPSAFCEGTLADEPEKTIAGHNVIWYTTSAGTTPTTAPTVQTLTAADSPSNFYYKVENSGTNCISAIHTYTVTVNPIPTETLTAPSAFCEGTLASEPVKTIPGRNIIWYTTSEGTATTTAPTVQTLTAVGSPYDFYYKVEDVSMNCPNCGCLSAIHTYTITVNTVPIETLTAPSAFCEGTLLSEPAKTITDRTIVWTNATGTIPEGEPTIIGLAASDTPYTYYYKVKVGDCESAVHTYTVTVNPLPVAVITKDPDITVLTCTTGEISLTATGGDSYSWNNGQNTQTITASQAGRYEVTVENGNGCTATAEVTLTEDKTKPTLSITKSPDVTELTCTIQSITLTANTDATSYSWSNGANTASVAASTIDRYEVTVTGTNGCTNTDFIHITQSNDMPQPTITPNTAILTCTTQSIRLAVTATGGDGSYSYSWGASADTTVTTPGNYSVKVTDENGCSGTASATITQNIAPPTVGITNNTGKTELTCSLTEINLTATSGVSYSWDNGLGSSANATVNAPGTYIVTATAANGCTNTASITITENKTPPTAGITNNSATTELTCTVTSISLTATGGVSYSWGNSLGSNANVTVNTAGTYVVTVTGSNGCTNTASITITTDGSRPTAGINNNTGVIVLTCTTPSISLTATGGGTYSWNNGLGSNANATVTSAGTYTVTVTDTNGCTDTESITITENKAEPNGSITNNSGTTILTCAKPSISLTATGGVSYLWSNGDNVANTTITAAGTYNVVITGANGCTGTRSITITADGSLPTIVITNNPATTELTCTTPSITLTASGGVSYSWDNRGNSASIIVTLAGIYTVDVTSINGCSATKSIEITSNQLLPTIEVNNADICLGDEAVLTASGANTYTWTPSGGLSATTGATVTANPETTTTYTVEGTVTETGCKNTARATVYVETPIELTLDAPRSVELGNELTITVTAERTDHGSFEWFLNDQPYRTISEYSLTLVPDAGKQHFLVHTATTKLNCPSSSEIYVEVSESIPNAINPYDLNGGNCCFMRGYHVEIYNRYMQKVFEGNDGWNGYYRGAPADPGTYFYRLYKKSGEIGKGTLDVIKFE